MGGVYVGEGLPPIPPILAPKILKWEFVEMAEMLPEYWPGTKSKEDDSKRAPTRRPRRVTKIFCMGPMLCLLCEHTGCRECTGIDGVSHNHYLGQPGFQRPSMGSI